LLPLLPSNTHEPFAVDALHALQHMLLLHPACRPAPAHPTWEWCRMSNTCRRSPLAHQPCPGCCTTCCTCCKAAWAPAVSACNLQQQWCTVAAVTVEPAHSGRQREMDEDMMVTRPHQQAATCCKIICHNTHVVLRGSCVKRSAKRRLPRTGTQLAGGGGGLLVPCTTTQLMTVPSPLNLTRQLLSVSGDGCLVCLHHPLHSW
jgi:hypothetical protein